MVITGKIVAVRGSPPFELEVGTAYLADTRFVSEPLQKFLAKGKE
jgi:hypothetical protein